MKHLSIAEVFLLIKAGGLDEQEKNRMVSHLKYCTDCQKMRDEMELNLQKTTQINSEICRKHISLLPDYLDDKLDVSQKIVLETHLGDCEHCQRILNWLENWPEWDTGSIQTVDIPNKVRSRIENKVFDALMQEKTESNVSVSHENVTQKVRAALQVLKLTFRPVVPDFAFRETHLKISKVIEHSGGDLVLRTGLPEVTIELTSVFEDFQINTKTNDKGEVSFSDLSRGEYMVQVPGFELERITIESLHQA